MIIVRTPLRISIGGGGSDLPSYYEQFGGFFISAAIDKHVYVGINKTFTKEYAIRYSSQERLTDPDEIRHPVVREAIKLHQLGPLEIVSLADIADSIADADLWTVTGKQMDIFVHDKKRNKFELCSRFDLDVDALASSLAGPNLCSVETGTLCLCLNSFWCRCGFSFS